MQYLTVTYNFIICLFPTLFILHCSHSSARYQHLHILSVHQLMERVFVLAEEW